MFMFAIITLNLNISDSNSNINCQKTQMSIRFVELCQNGCQWWSLQ